MAVSNYEGRLHPVCVSGVQPNLRACLSFTAHAIGAGDFEPPSNDAFAPDWMPGWAVPVRVEEQVRGLLVLGHKCSGSIYSVADRELILEAAAQIAHIPRSERLSGLIDARLASSRRIDMDLKSARDIQMRFLPYRRPHIDGLDYHRDCVPAGSRTPSMRGAGSCARRGL